MPKDPLQLVDLTTARTDFEAEVIRLALEGDGIPAKAFSGPGSILQWEIAASQPIRVQVRRCDLEKARLSLARTRQESVDFDWSELDAEEIDTVCPSCGYPLKGVADPTLCPECGGRHAHGGVVDSRKHERGKHIVWKFVTLLLLAMLLLPVAIGLLRTLLRLP